MSVRLLSSSTKLFPLRTRMPFRYGIATATEIPHLIFRGEFEIDGQQQIGLAADHLPPKWFTKDPSTTFEHDVAELRAAIDVARLCAQDVGRPPTVFDLWKRVYNTRKPFSAVPLVHSFAVSLVERAAIDAFCRATGQTFTDALRRNTLGMRLYEVNADLVGVEDPAELLPPQPLRSLTVRHTVGLSDPLTNDDFPDDGLPQSLRDCAVRYGLTHFKIKISGEAARDVERLRQIAAVVPDTVAFTLDGNENFREVEHFREFWERFIAEPALESFRRKLLFVEQPLHRDVALGIETARAFFRWRNRPPMIIDESDDGLTSGGLARDFGYRGTSYKSCKGVFKGIANACLMRYQPPPPDLPRREESIISAEDLTTVGPVSLPQDLAVIGSLGIGHVERNGHHYFRGLSMWPRDLQEHLLAAHGDLYEDGGGFATLRIRGGRIDVGSVVDAPFGYAAGAADFLDRTGS